MAGDVTTFLNTATLPEMSDLVKKQFSFVSERVKPAAAPLFINENLLNHGSQMKHYYEIDTELFGRRKREGEAQKRAKGGVGYNKTMYAKRYAMSIELTYEFKKFSEDYAQRAIAKLQSLTNFMPQRRELDLTHRFTFATSTSYVNMDGETVDVSTGDGLALAYSAHTLAHSSDTYRNRLAGDPEISVGALELARNLFNTDLKDNFGKKIIMEPNTIITGADEVTINTVKKILNSTADLSAANNGVINTQRARYRHVILPYLASDAEGGNDSTKRRWWALACTGMGANGWQAYFGTFEADNLKTPDENKETDVWVFGVRGTWGIVATTGRGIVFSCPTN